MFFITNAYALTNYEIFKVCKRYKKEQGCVKRLKINRYKLNKGIPIEIPVLPYNK